MMFNIGSFILRRVLTATTLLMFTAGTWSMMTMSMSDNFLDHPCRRQCDGGGKPMVCEYDFNVELFSTMGRACLYCPNRPADCERSECILGSGTQRAVFVVNRQMPGPSIAVCRGDRIRVKVNNMADNGESTSIHWHGLHQVGTPYMDGVAMFTQCPILPGTSFTYDFEAALSGTFFYHSHSGIQRGDGLAGPLIIRDRKDPHRKLYDRDDLQPVMTQDWLPDETTTNLFAKFTFGNSGDEVPLIMVNGRMPTHGLVDHSDNLTLAPFPVPVPPYTYRLNPKLRYRFRLINNAFGETPMKFEITGHNMVVIASDGMSLKPVVTRTLSLMSAERYDVIPYFTGEEVSPQGIYYIQVSNSNDPNVTAFARIAYESGRNPRKSDAWTASGQATRQVLDEVNYVHFDAEHQNDEDLVKVSQLRSTRSVGIENSLEGEPDLKLLTEFDFEVVRKQMASPIKIVRPDAPTISPVFPGKFLIPRINKITNLMEPPVPLLSQWEEVPSKLYCNAEHRRCPADDYCECIHLEPIKKGALVELFMVDNGIAFPTHQLLHPMHLHGHHFGVVAMEAVYSNLTGAEVMKMDRLGQIKKNLKNPPIKDTIGVPTGGYVVARFRADNPGFWLFHCHIDFHMQLGMTMVFRVGEPGDLSPPPPHFPRCSSWKAPRYNAKG